MQPKVGIVNTNAAMHMVNKSQFIQAWVSACFALLNMSEHIPMTNKFMDNVTVHTVNILCE